LPNRKFGSVHYAIFGLIIYYIFKYLYQLVGIIRKAWESSQQIVLLHINNVHYPVSYWTEKGGRPYQEDRHDEIRGSCSKDCSLYGVFDGHGGMQAAEYCKENMLKTILAEHEFENNPSLAMKNAFHKVDKNFVEKGKKQGLSDGTTAVVAVISNNQITVANAGDSRGIVVQKNGVHFPMSFDHKPNR
jgi:protein phosphatase 1L